MNYKAIYENQIKKNFRMQTLPIALNSILPL